MGEIDSLVFNLVKIEWYTIHFKFMDAIIRETFQKKDDDILFVWRLFEMIIPQRKVNEFSGGI